MSESSLVTYRRYTTNYSKSTLPKTKITIHHMAGKMTAKQCVDLFMNKNRQASAQYCIGYDGSIGQSVSETNRAWTSSSSWNDSRAVTIEVSNDKVGEPWAISQASYNALVELCADICKRNGIKSVNYDGTKNAVLTEHRFYAATACPGTTIHNYLVSGKLVKDINNKINSTSASVPTTPATPSIPANYIYNGVDYSYVFNPTYYADKYADLKKAFGTDAQKLFAHFISNGMGECRQANADFNVIVYKNDAKNADLVKAFGTNMPMYYMHYCVVGRSEPRKHN